MKKHKNVQNFVDVDDVDARGGATVGGPIRDPLHCGANWRWTVSVSDFAVLGVEPQCGGSDIADIAPPTLWVQLQPHATPRHSHQTPQKRNFVDVDGENVAKTKEILKRS